MVLQPNNNDVWVCPEIGDYPQRGSMAMSMVEVGLWVDSSQCFRQFRIWSGKSQVLVGKSSKHI